MPSIIQAWVENIGLRHQDVLISAMRGCDTAPRYDPSKLVQRLLRGAVLEPHCGRTGKPMTCIMVEPDHDKWWEIAYPFLRSWDHYPNHYVMHFIHAADASLVIKAVEAQLPLSSATSDFPGEDVI